MTLSVLHSFVSGIPDGANTAVVRPSNWNAEHTLTAGAETLLGNATTSSGPVTELSVPQVLAMLNTQTNVTVITVSTTPYTVSSDDAVILYYRTVALAITTLNLSSASLRGGLPLIVKDVAGNGAADIINIVPNGGETIDGLASLPLNSNFGGFKLVPLSTWTAGGWYISP